MQQAASSKPGSEVVMETPQEARPGAPVVSKPRVLKLEGDATPDLPLMADEKVVMDLSQGWRDLGLVGKVLGHKGRLIVTNRRAIYFKKKTRDYDIQQLRLSHTGYVTMGHRLQFLQFVNALIFVVVGISAMIGEQVTAGLVMLVVGGIMLFTARKQGLVLGGSGGSIPFNSRSVPHTELSKILTIVNALR